MGFYESSFEYDNEIAYLKDNPFTSKRGWMWKASIKHCRCVLAISLNPGSSDAEQEVSDKKNIFIVHKILEAYPKTEITMIVET